MPEITIKIGQRRYTVNCPAGEEPQFDKDRAAWDAEHSTMLTPMGRLPAAPLLLMSGLMLADRTLALEEKLTTAEAASELAQQDIQKVSPEIKTVTTEVAVAVVQPALLARLADISARAEPAAAELEDKIAQSAG